MSVLELLVCLCVGLVAYSYVGYPVVLSGVAAIVQLVRDARFVLRKDDRRQGEASDPNGLATVTVVIAAFNEQRHIQRRVDNLLALTYPSGRVQYLIGSDGSTDRTADILRACADPRIQAVIFDSNRGKASVLNELLSRATGEIVVFSDANTFFHPDALERLVGHFSDPGVGCVSGELRLISTGGNNQDSLYWRVEQLLKFFESRIGGLLGANGAIYAIRRSLWRPLREDTICDDFCVAMSVAASGAKLVYEPAAWAEEDCPEAIDEEFHRRVRIGIGNFQALIRHPEYFMRTSWGTRLAYASHKVLRWVAPHLLLTALALSLVLSVQSAQWQWLAALQLLSIGGAALLYGVSRRWLGMPGVLKVVAFLYALNWAFLVASWRYVRGDYRGSWRRTSR